MRKQFHLSMSVSGALQNKAFYGFADDKGNEMSPFEVKKILLDMQSRGIKSFVMDSDCDNQSDGCCLGHPIDD